MKPKAKTIIEKFGFCDSDLSSKNHDELLVWTSANISEILNESGILKKERKDFYDIIRKANIPDFVDKKIIEKKLHPFPRFKWNVRKIKYEVPIKSKDYIIGFIDAQVILQIPYFQIGYTKIIIDECPHKLTSMAYMHCIYDQNRRRSEECNKRKECIKKGYEKERVIISWKSFDPEHLIINIEIKTKINSLGELLRQMNTYKTYDRERIFLIISPDDKFKSQIENQGFYFYSPRLK